MEPAPLVPASTAGCEQFKRLCISLMESEEKSTRARVNACIYRLESSGVFSPLSGHSAAVSFPRCFQQQLTGGQITKGASVFSGGLRNQNTFLTCLPPQTKVAHAGEQAGWASDVGRAEERVGSQEAVVGVRGGGGGGGVAS